MTKLDTFFMLDGGNGDQEAKGRTYAELREQCMDVFVQINASKDESEFYIKTSFLNDDVCPGVLLRYSEEEQAWQIDRYERETQYEMSRNGTVIDMDTFDSET